MSHRLAAPPSLRLPLYLSIALLCAACSDDPPPADDKDTTAASDVVDAGGDTAAADTKVTLPAPTTPSVTLDNGDASLEINLDRDDLVLRRKGQWRTRIELRRLRIGRVDRFDEDLSYNPGDYAVSAVADDNELPDKFAWLKITAASFVAHEPGPLMRADDGPWPLLGKTGEHCKTPADAGVTVRLATADAGGEKGPDWELIVRPVSSCAGTETPATFAFDLAPAAGLPQGAEQGRIDAVVWLDLALTTGREVRFYGLGEYFDSAEHRGRVRPMQIQADLSVESAYNEAHVPVPLLVGTNGWGAFVQSRRPAIFDCGVQDPDRVHARFHADSLRVFLFAPESGLDVSGAYTRVSGAPVLPAQWAFGGLIWRNENKDDAEVIDDMQQIRKHGLAISGMWLDRPYDTHVNNFDFDPDRFKDADAMIKKVRDLGMRVAAWSTPYVEEGGKYRKEFVDKGWMIKVPALAKQFLKWGGPVDLSNKDAKARWKELIGKLRKRGVEGWKLDFGEDVHVSLFTVRAHYDFANGGDERDMHHGVALYYHAPYFETLPGAEHLHSVDAQLANPAAGGFILARAGTYGGQSLASIIWPGDLDASFAEHGWCDDETCHVAGLPGAVAASQSLATSGYPLFASDTGGYRHHRADKEVFLRWLAHTALSPILQIGGSKQHNPWDFTQYKNSKFDQEVLDAAIAWTGLHMRLFPYRYGLAVAAARHRRGPIRPFGLAHPELRRHGPTKAAFAAAAATQYWLGDALLVAPVVAADPRRLVVLPAAKLYDWWTHERVNAVTLSSAPTPTVLDLKVPLDRAPLYLRGGRILPMLRPGVDTLAPTTEASVDSFVDKVGRLHAITAPGPDSTRTLYDGTQLSFAIDGKAIRLAVQPGKVFKEGVQWSIWSKSKLKAVAVGDTPAPEKASAGQAGDCTGCWWRDSKDAIHVRLPPGAATAVLLFANKPQ